ncbi:unnamed protein product [Dicrocoelium dendriticum]|nr:unnamed protein product [Dicrocoelium dendriticum]
MPRRTHGTVHRLPSKRTMDEVPSDDEQAVLSSQDSDISSVHEAESAHAKRVRLTRRIVQEAKRQIGSDEEELNMYSMKLKEEALFEKGKLMVSIALKVVN